MGLLSIALPAHADDASSARQARKKALESLIDSATDRRDRGGAKIYSLGIPVGFAFGGRFAPGDDLHYPSVHSAYDADVLMQLRLPLAIARQRLPAENGCVGTHLAFWVADLGQFTRSKPSGASDALSWKDFVGFGAQAGVLLGTSSHAVVLALEGSWSPGLYAKDVNIDNMSGDGTHVHHLSGAFTLGATLAYYVPLFDFN